jgi:hypothetical protein
MKFFFLLKVHSPQLKPSLPLRKNKDNKSNPLPISPSLQINNLKMARTAIFPRVRGAIAPIARTHTPRNEVDLKTTTAPQSHDTASAPPETHHSKDTLPDTTSPEA